MLDGASKDFDLLQWVDTVEAASDPDVQDSIEQKFIDVHIESSFYDSGGAVQKQIRGHIYDMLKSYRDNINQYAREWLLGGSGAYIINNTTSDGESIKTTFTVPTAQLSPFSESWPTPPQFTQGRLANINHIIVLMMENRSFDQMLGYLSLPEASGGMARSDVDGLTADAKSKVSNSNVLNGVTFYSFEFGPTDTVFFPDPLQ